jgi:hypothetical protein
MAEFWILAPGSYLKKCLAYNGSQIYQLQTQSAGILSIFLWSYTND